MNKYTYTRWGHYCVIINNSLWQGKKDSASGTRGYRFKIVRKQHVSELYVSTSQGQAKRPDQLMAMQYEDNLEMNVMFATAKAGRSAQPILWQCSSKTTCKWTFCLPQPRRGKAPSPAYGNAVPKNYNGKAAKTKHGEVSYRLSTLLYHNKIITVVNPPEQESGKFVYNLSTLLCYNQIL